MKPQLSFIVNIGSTSKKYAIFDNKGQEIVCGKFIKEKNKFVLSKKEYTVEQNITVQEFEQSVDYFFKILKNEDIISSDEQIQTIGIRIVAPGKYFTQTRVLNAKYKTNLEQVKDIVPLHIIPILNEIEYISFVFPNVKIVAISDSSFHSTIEQHLRSYAINRSDTHKFDIYRFGYHGISVQSIIRKLKKEEKELPKNIIVCHLGGGSSITAVKNGKSFDTSMGFSPFEGVPMATRVGSIDPGALLYLQKQLSFSHRQMNNYLNTRCGLLGLSEKTGNMEELLKLEEQGDKIVHQAIEFFIYNIQKYIGAYHAILNGLDVLIFTGGIGSFCPAMRSRICCGLTSLNIFVDNEMNKTLVNKDGFFHNSTSRVKVATIVTSEMSEMAAEIEKFLQKRSPN